MWHSSVPLNEACGYVATSSPLTGYEPNEYHNFEDMEVTTAIFQSSSVTSPFDHGDYLAMSPDVEVDDEHIRKALTSSLYLQEKEVTAKLITLMKKDCYQVLNQS